MNSTTTAIRGSFFDFIDDPWRHIGNEQAAARFIKDGLLVTEGGVIKDFGPYAEVSKRYPNVPVTHLRDRLIVPGFIDGHIHFPQTRVLGAYGEQLLDWLQNSIFCEELKYADRDYSRTAAKHFFDALLAGGTTTCQAFTTSSPISTEEFFEEATRRNMRVIAGLTGIDRFAPDNCKITADDFYRETKRLIKQYHRQGRNLYAITPRFAVGCTDEMMERCHQLKMEHDDCWINTHISENPTELRTSRMEFPDCADYTAVHEKHGLFGAKFTAGHGVWLSDDEFRRFSAAAPRLHFAHFRTCSSAADCSVWAGQWIPIIACEFAWVATWGAATPSAWCRVMEEAYKVGMCNNTMLDGSVNPREQNAAEAERNKLSPYRAFYLATLGGANALYLDDVLGNFNTGKEADFVALDWNAGQLAMAWHQSLTTNDGSVETMDQAAKLLFGIMAVGDDRNVDETWIAGKRAYQKPGSTAGVQGLTTLDLNSLGGKPVKESKVAAVVGTR